MAIPHPDPSRPDTPAPPADADGLATLASPYSVAETLDRLETILRDKGVTVFARVDHAAAAAGSGLAMRPTQVLIFGNPKLGTPVMQAAPSVAIDLPFKALAWEDVTGKVWLSYNSPDYLARRHGIADAVIAPLAAVAKPIAAAVQPR